MIWGGSFDRQKGHDNWRVCLILFGFFWVRICNASTACTHLSTLGAHGHEGEVTECKTSLSESVLPPLSLFVVAGAGQHAAVHATVPIDPVVLLLDSNGQPFSGLELHFSVDSGGGAIQSGVALTDSNGLASPGWWRLSTRAGVNRLMVFSADSLLGSDTLILEATGLARAAVQLQFIDVQQDAVAGLVFLEALGVEAVDSFGNRDSSFRLECTLYLLLPGGSFYGQFYPITVNSDSGLVLWNGLMLHRALDSVQWMVQAAGFDTLFGQIFRIRARLPSGLSLGVDSITGIYGDTLGQLMATLSDDGGDSIMFRLEASGASSFLVLDSATGAFNCLPDCPVGVFVVIISAVNQEGSCSDTLVLQILPAPLHVVVYPHIKEYGDSLPPLASPGDPRVEVTGLRAWDAWSFVRLVYGGAFGAHRPVQDVGSYHVQIDSIEFHIGTQASNYQIVEISDSIIIFPARLQVTGLVALIKEYNDSLNVLISGNPEFVGLVNQDQYSVDGNVTWNFNGAEVGEHKPLNRNGTYTLASVNYWVEQPELTGTITKRTLRFSLFPLNKVYGDSTATFGPANELAHFYGLQGDDQLIGLSIHVGGNQPGNHRRAAVGQYSARLDSISFAHPLDWYNYTFESDTGSLIVNPAPLTIQGLSASPKTYDGTDSVNISGIPVFVGLKNDDTARAEGSPMWRFQDMHVGLNKVLIQSGLYLSSNANYVVVQPALYADILSRSLVVAGSRMADGTTWISYELLNIMNMIQGDELILESGQAFIDSIFPGNRRIISSGTLVLTGRSATNYTLNGMSGEVMITPRVIRMIGSFEAESKLFDGSAQANIVSSQLQFDNLIPGFQSLNVIQPTAAFKSGGYGVNKKVYLVDFEVNGPDLIHYMVDRSQFLSSSASINPQFALGSEGSGVDIVSDSSQFLSGSQLLVGLNLLVSLENDTVLAGDSMLCSFSLRDIRGRLAEFYQNDTLNLRLFTAPVAARLLTPSVIMLIRGMALADVSVDRGGQYSIHAWFRSAVDSVSVTSNTFMVRRPIARVEGSFRVLPKAFDGSTLANMGANHLSALVLPSDSGLVWIDSIRLEFVGASLGVGKNVKLVYCVLSGPLSGYYDLFLGNIYSNGDVFGWTVRNGDYGGNDCLSRESSHIDGHDLLPRMNIEDSVLFHSALLRSGDTIPLQVEFLTIRNRRADYVSPSLAHFYLIGTPFNPRGYSYLQGDTQDSVIRGCSRFLSLWIGKGGDNFRLGVRSFVDGIWLHDTTVTFNLLPPFLKLSGLYKVANKTYDGNKNAQVSDITELIGIVDLPSPFNDSFPPLACEASFISASVGTRRRTHLTSIQYDPTIEEAFTLVFAGYGSTAEIHSAVGLGSQGRGDQLLAHSGILLDGALPIIQLQWSNPPSPRDITSSIIRAGDSLTCAIQAINQRGVKAEFFDQIGVQIQIQFSSAANRLYGSPISMFTRGEAVFPHFTLNRSSLIVLSVQWPQNPPFPTSSLTSDTLILYRPLLTVTGTFRTCDKMYNGSKEAVLCHSDSMRFHPLPYGNDFIRLLSSRPYYFAPASGKLRRAYLSDTSMVLGDSAIHYDLSPVLLYGYGNIDPPFTRGGISTGSHLLSQSGVFLEGSTVQFSLRVSQQPVFLRLPVHPMIFNRAGDTFQFEVKLFTQRDRIADYIGQLPVRFSALYPSAYPVRLYGDTVKNLTHSVATAVHLAFNRPGTALMVRAFSQIPGGQSLSCTSSTLNLEKAVLNISGFIRDVPKVFDGTTQVTGMDTTGLRYTRLPVISGIMSSDQIYLGNLVLNYRSPCIGTKKKLFIASFSIRGPDSMHYELGVVNPILVGEIGASGNSGGQRSGAHVQSQLGYLLDGGSAMPFSIGWLNSPAPWGNRAGMPISGARSGRPGVGVFNHRYRLLEHLSDSLILVGVAAGHPKNPIAFGSLRIPLNRGFARLDSISLNRGGQGFRLLAGLRIGLDSFSAASDTFNLEKPIALLMGDFQMTTKKYDGNTLGAIFSQTWFVRPLPVGGDSLVIQPIEARFRSPSVGDRKKAVLWNYQIAGNASAEYEYSYRINGTGVVTEGKLGGSDSSIGYSPTICRHLDWSPIDSGRIVCSGLPSAPRRAGELFRFKAELQTNRGKWAEHIDTVRLNVQMTQGPSGWLGYELPHSALLIRGQYSSDFWSVSRSGSYRLQLDPGTNQRWRAIESSFSVEKPLSVISGFLNGQDRVWNGNKSVVVTDFSSLQASRLTFTQDELTIQSVTAEFLSSATGLNKRIRPTALVLGGRDAVHYDVVAGSSVQGRAHIFSPSALGGQSTTTIGFAQKVGSFLGDSCIGVMFLSTRSSNYSSLPCGDEIPDLEISVINANQRVIKDWGNDIRVLPDFYGNQYRGDIGYFMEAGRTRILNLRPETAVLSSLGLSSGILTTQINAPSLQILPCVTGHTSSSHRSALLSGVDLSGQRSVSIGISGSFSVKNKLYDGSRNAQISAFNLQIIGQSPGDQVFLDSVRANFRSKYPGDQKQVVLDTALRLIGRDASKYRLAFFGAPTTTASIISQNRRGFWGQGSDLDTNGLLFFSGDTAVVAQGSFTASGKEFNGQVAYSGPINMADITLTGIRPGHQLALGSLTARFLSANPGDKKNMQVEQIQFQGSHFSRYRLDRSRLPAGLGPIFAPTYASGPGARSGFKATDTLFISDGSVVTPHQLVIDEIRGITSSSNRLDVSYRFTDALNRSVPWGPDCVRLNFYSELDSALWMPREFRAHTYRGGGLFSDVQVPVSPGSNKLLISSCDTSGPGIDSQSLSWLNHYPGINKPNGVGAYSNGVYTQGLDGGVADVWVGGWPNQARNWFEPLNWSRRKVPTDTAQIWVPIRRDQPIIQQPMGLGMNSVQISQPGTMHILDGGSCTLGATSFDSIFPGSIGLLVNDGGVISTEGSGFLNIGSGGHYVNMGSSQPNLRIEKQLTGTRGWRLISAPVRSSFRDFLDSVVIQGVSGSEFPNWQPNVLHFLESDTGTHLQSWRTIQTPLDSVVSGRGQAVYVFDGALFPNGVQGNYRDSLPKTLLINGFEPILNRETWFNFAPELTFTPRSIYANNQVTPDSIYTDLMESDAGWNLLGNPTASPLYWAPNSNLWQRTRVDETIYSWDPSMNDHVGGYRYWNGQTGNYKDTAGGVAIIRPFQAFWIHANAPNPILKFRGDSKLLNQVGAVVRRSSPIQINLSYSIDGMSTQGYVSFGDGGKLGRDESDAYFLPPQADDWVSLYTLSAPGSYWPLSINCLPITPTPYRSIPLFVQAGRAGTPITGKIGHIGWQFSEGWPNHWFPVLMDHTHRRAVPMRRQTEYKIEAANAKDWEKTLLKDQHTALFNLKLPGAGQNQSGLRTSKGRPNLSTRWPYSIVIMESEQEPEYFYRPDVPELYPPFPNPARSYVWFRYFLPESTELRIEVCDLSGRLIWESSVPSSAAGMGQMRFEAHGLSSGVYLVKLLTPYHSAVQRFVLCA